ncbi:MAG: acyl carrier protein [Myxococcales bacterium]|nr:acyl carrier protein [Myxococcales bacterium]
MTRQEVQQIILTIIADIAPDEDLHDVKPEVRLRDQLDLDSMDFLDIVMELRKRYKIEVPEEDYMELASLDGCVRYLGPKFAEKGIETTASA